MKLLKLLRKPLRRKDLIKSFKGFKGFKGFTGSEVRIVEVTIWGL